MATQLTPGGMPYPDGSEKVVDGDNAMRAIAEGVDKRPTLIASNNNSQSIPNNAFTTLVGLTASLTRDITYVQATGIATITRAGLYEIVAFVSINGGGSVGNRVFRINRNAVADANAIAYDIVTGQAGHVALAIHHFASLAATDTIRLMALQASGGALPTVISAVGGYETKLAIIWRGNAT